MTNSPPTALLVFHAGALGDFILAWPLLRALTSAGHTVHLVAADAHARLAARFLGTRPLSAERREVTMLWTSPRHTEVAAAWRPLVAHAPPRAVISVVADTDTDAGRAWTAAAASIPGVTEVLPFGPPGSAARAALWRRFGAHAAQPAPRPPIAGPIIAHVGAGSRQKMWPMDRWRRLVETSPCDARPIHLIAGPVEHERLTADERDTFDTLRGRLLTSLDDLADILLAASAYVGGDTGPTHLAAQLGLPTLALFGPTDPVLWGPVGPAVRILAPQGPSPMTHLSVEDVRLGLNTLTNRSAASN